MSLTKTENTYRGRFAPSPTGPLHFGSLVAAVGSFLSARSRGGQWLVRIEDLDAPRQVPGAADRILRTLEAFGMAWDDPVMYQSTRKEAYEAALQRLRSQGAVYACGCTRREIADSSIGGSAGAIYPGTCRRGLAPGHLPRVLRVRVDGPAVAFEDRVQGRLSHFLGSESGDFVVRRADGLFAYQLAVVVDDGEQGITEVVRGADLLDSTPRQIHLQRLLGLPTPQYLHLPVAVDARGEKLSKQTRAAPLGSARPVPLLAGALAFLGQRPPAELAGAEVDEFWRWAVAHWRAGRIPRVRALAAP